MLNEFKKFAIRGNVIDLAIGVIIGAAFTGIVNSLVRDLMMPPLGLLLGGLDFSNFFFTLKGPAFTTLAEAQKAGAVTINYGQFLNTMVNFLVVAFAMFLVVRSANKLKATPPEPPPAPPEELAVLKEIRDVLKERK
jgi:large conductance mechanosensitive channel